MATLSLRALLGLDSSGFEKGIDRSRGKTSQLKKDFEKLKGQIAGTFSIYFIARHTDAMIKNGAAVYDASKRYNISTASVQSFSYALEQNGNTLEELAISWTAMRKARERALAGDEKTLGQFANLGINPSDLALGDEDLFLKMADNVKVFTGNVDELKTSLDGTLGETGVKLLKSMREGIRELQQDFVNMGGVIDSSVIAKMKEIDGELLKYSYKLKAMVSRALPGAERGFNAAQGIGAFINSGFIKAGEILTGRDFGSGKWYQRAVDEWAAAMAGGSATSSPPPNLDRPSLGGSGVNSGGYDPPSVNTPALRPPSFAVNDPLVGIGNFLLAQRSTVNIQKQQLQRMDAILSMITTAVTKGI